MGSSTDKRIEKLEQAIKPEGGLIVFLQNYGNPGMFRTLNQAGQQVDMTAAEARELADRGGYADVIWVTYDKNWRAGNALQSP